MGQETVMVMFYVFAFAFTFLILYLLFTVGKAVFVKKDERMKMILTKSMAQAFVILFVLYVIQVALKFILGANYEIWWANFTNGIYIEPAMLCIIILGITLFINKRRYGS